MSSHALSQGVDALSRRFVASTFLRALGFQATYFVGIIGSATYLLGADAFEVSLLIVILNISIVVAGGLAGVLVDHIGPRLTLFATLIVLGATALLALALPLGIPMLAIVTVLEGCAAGICSAAASAYPRYLTERVAGLQKINSYNNTANCVAVIAGPLLGGWITAISSNQLVFSVLPITTFVSAVLVWLTPELLHPEHQERQSSQAFWKQLAEGIQITFSHPVIRALFLIYFLGYFAYGAFDSLEALFYRDVLQVGSEWMGWLSACAGLGATVGALAVSRFPVRRLDLTTSAALLVVVGVGSMIYVGTNHVEIAVIGQIVSGLGFGALGPVKDTVLQKSCDLSYLGRVTSVLSVGMNSAGTLPLLVAPFLADAFGVQATLFSASAIAFAIGICALIWTIRTRESR